MIAAGARLREKESQQWPEARRRQLLSQLRARRASGRGCSPQVSPHLAAHPCTSALEAAVAGHRHAVAHIVCTPGVVIRTCSLRASEASCEAVAAQNASLSSSDR